MSDYKPPKLSVHKATGRAFVKSQGRFIYFGKAGTPEAQEAYEIWVREQMRLNDPKGRLTTRIDRLCVEFLKFAGERYVDPKGKPTGEAELYVNILKVVVRMFGDTPASEFGPLKLKAVRDEFVRLGWTRKSINRQLNRVRMVFKWGAENEMVPGSVVADLGCVAGIRKGQRGVLEADPVGPAPHDSITAALPFMPPVVAEMVRLQLVTGMRPSECRLLTLGQLDTSGDVWIYTPESHKTAHHGKSRIIPIGPRGQAVLAPLIADAVRNDHVVFQAGPGRPYRLDAYRRAITRACEAAGVEPFSPNQLRHTFASDLRRASGDLDGVRCILGHSETALSVIPLSLQGESEQALEQGAEFLQGLLRWQRA